MKYPFNPTGFDICIIELIGISNLSNIDKVFDIIQSKYPLEGINPDVRTAQFHIAQVQMR